MNHKPTGPIARRDAIRRTLALSLAGTVWPMLSGGAENRMPPAKSNSMNTNPRLFSFVGGREGSWKAVESRIITSEAVPAIERLNVIAGHVATPPAGALWVLRGVTSNER